MFPENVLAVRMGTGIDITGNLHREFACSRPINNSGSLPSHKMEMFHNVAACVDSGNH
jgi:hypothetical protein